MPAAALAAALIAAPSGREQATGFVQAWLLANAAAQAAKSVPVTVDAFIRAETDTYFKKRTDLGPLRKEALDDSWRFPVAQPAVKLER